MKRSEERGDGGSNTYDVGIYFGKRKREFMKNRGSHQEEQELETLKSKYIEIADRELLRGAANLLHTSGFPIEPMIKKGLENPPLSRLRNFVQSGKEDAME